jgi:putative tryptophan/tyrosine transport system substrate-binding protein
MKNHVGRREFITLLGGAAAAWPVGARSQQPAMPVIGYLGGESPGPFANRLRAFHRGLSETGYVEGRNVAIEYRWAESQYDRLPALAADLVRRQVNVIATPGSTLAARAAKAATATIPIVFQNGTDPIAAGLVASLNRPGGNLTGVTSLNTELGPKLLEVLHELVPAATTLALLVNPTEANIEPQLRDMQAAARTLGLPQLHVLHASTERDFDNVFAALVQVRAGGLVINSGTLFGTRSGSERLAALAMHHAVPAISPYREFAPAGGLMSYGGNVPDQDRLVGNYTGRILKGENPSDLPVHQISTVSNSLKYNQLLNESSAWANRGLLCDLQSGAPQDRTRPG